MAHDLLLGLLVGGSCKCLVSLLSSLAREMSSSIFDVLFRAARSTWEIDTYYYSTFPSQSTKSMV